jgi:hypothetical protein
MHVYMYICIYIHVYIKHMCIYIYIYIYIYKHSIYKYTHLAIGCKEYLIFLIYKLPVALYKIKVSLTRTVTEHVCVV